MLEQNKVDGLNEGNLNLSKAKFLKPLFFRLLLIFNCTILGLVVNDNYYENVLEGSKFSPAFFYRRLREKINPKDWIDHQAVAVANAFYDFNTNSIEFPAGILQGVFFDSKIPKYMNYGAIGGVIGHELTHGFDDQGRRADYKGEFGVQQILHTPTYI